MSTLYSPWSRTIRVRPTEKRTSCPPSLEAGPPYSGAVLGAVNSINWARVLAQVVYYFTAAASLGSPARPVSFTVPTGNFGDVFAGYVAHRMGLPVAKLIVATNVNDILHRAISAGDYSAGSVTPTAAPSMPGTARMSSRASWMLSMLIGLRRKPEAPRLMASTSTLLTNLTTGVSSPLASTPLSPPADRPPRPRPRPRHRSPPRCRPPAAARRPAPARRSCACRAWSGTWPACRPGGYPGPPSGRARPRPVP